LLSGRMTPINTAGTAQDDYGDKKQATVYD
jgi:hypothetical protein